MNPLQSLACFIATEEAVHSHKTKSHPEPLTGAPGGMSPAFLPGHREGAAALMTTAV